MKLISSMKNGTFCLMIECTPHAVEDVRRLAAFGKDLLALNERLASRRLAVPAVSLTQSPGGNPSYDQHEAIARLRELGWPEEIELIPHVTGKDRNAAALAMELEAWPDRGVETILALTGDLPAGRGVYELDSLGLLQGVRRANAARLRGAADAAAFTALPLLRAGAAVSPFKYTEGSLAMQMIKAAKKAHEGAAFLVCQAGWDAERSEALIAEWAETSVPLLGNVLFLNETAARAMRELPGCVISEALLERLHGETEADAKTRAAQQIAMFRALGYGGVDLGKPGDWRSVGDIEEIVEQALAISDWRMFRENLTFPPPPQPAPRVRTSPVFSRAVHRAAFEERSPLHGVAKGLLYPVETSAQREGVLYRLFKAMEEFGKGAVYECAHCGDCFLPENEYVCTMGACEKGLPNVPCGDADPGGRCGNDKNRICAGEKVYRRLMRHGTLEAYKQAVFPPRRAALQGTSSLLNRFYARDHLARPRPLASSGLIQIAELLHASIPYASMALRALLDEETAGADGVGRGRLAVEDLIRSQAEAGGDYIDVNLDALGAPDAPAFMRRVVQLVHREGLGVPVSIDSSDPAVLAAGLDAWIALGPEAAPALINSVTWSEFDRYLPLLARRRERPFRVIGLLVGREGPLKSADAMVEAARAMFARLRPLGFEADDILFDTVTLGVGTDGFMDAQGGMKSSHTRESFLAIRRLREDADLRGVHAVLGVSNWVYGVKKRRLGHLRAFIAVAKTYGLDAAIVDVAKEFGVKPPPSELVELVEMFAALDGGEDSMARYFETMERMREAGWV